MSLGTPVRSLSGVNSIVQDTDGFIWIGGENGLARYDGKQLRVYQGDPTTPGRLPNHYIWKMAVDRLGQMWVVTSAGPCIYRPETDSFELITSVGDQPLLSTITTAIAIDEGNKIYVGSAVGLNIFDLANQTMSAFVLDKPKQNTDSNNTVHDLAIDKDGNVWIATALTGVQKLNPKTGKITDFHHDENNPDSISFNHVKSLLYDSSGRLWAGTYGGGLNILDPATGKSSLVDYQIAGFGHGRNTIVMDIMEDSQGFIWASVDQQGVLKFDKNLQLVEHFYHSSGSTNSLLTNQARALFEDANNDVWIGAFPFGVSFLNRSQESIQTFQSDANNPGTLSNNAILSMIQDSRGIIWIGTEVGLNAYDPKTRKFTRYLSDAQNPDALAANAILSLAEDASGDLWVGTWSGGLHRFNPRTQKFKRYPHNLANPNEVGGPFVWTIMKDSTDTIWIGTESGGLQRYRPETDDFFRYQYDPDNPASISNNYLSDIIEDTHGDLWIATYAGVNKFDRKTEKFFSLQPVEGNPASLSTQAVKTVFQDSRGYIWAGGHEKGLNRIDPKTLEIKRIGVRDGLPSETISTIQEDANGEIWLGTNNGLVRMHPETFAMSVFNVGHGLIGGNYNRNASLIDRDGKFYFGSTEGVTAFKPEDMHADGSLHPIRITHFRILNQEVVIGAEDSPLTKSILKTEALELNHAANMFSFDFVMLNFRNPDLNKYAYKLEGFDVDWNYVDQRNTATYTNLDPGRYRFRVQAQAPGEEWTIGDRSISITIAPPAWKTWWAYCIYLILGIAFIYAVYLVGKLKKTSDNYKELSLTDPLTGIYNRAGISQIVKGLFANEEIKNGVCVMMMDIDHFKPINDLRGHDAGDKVITQIVDIITTVIRQGDYFGRWGGEEFILLCSSSTPLGVKQLAEKIRTVVAAHEFDPFGQSLRVTLSIGISIVHADENFDTALKRADQALYQAKSSGRNRAILADPYEAKA